MAGFAASAFLAGSALAAGFAASAFLAGAAFLAAGFLAAGFFAAGFLAALGASSFTGSALTAAFLTALATATVQVWFSPPTSCQICRRAPFSWFMPTTSRHLPDRLDLIFTRPSPVDSSTHSWLEPLAPSHWWTQVPSTTPPAIRSSILPVKRLQMR